MAKPSYDHVSIAPAIDVPPPVARPKPAGRTLREVATQHVIYIHPAAAKALKLYAVERNVKVHDLLIEALQDWFGNHGLRAPVRAKPREPA